MNRCTHENWNPLFHDYCPDCGDANPDTAQGLRNRIVELEAENARLREALCLVLANWINYETVFTADIEAALLGGGE